MSTENETEKVETKALSQDAVSGSFFIPKSAQKWLIKGDRGISSETMFGAITGLYINESKYPPSDPSDFYRCYKLIKEVPEFKSGLYKVSKISKTWENIINNWDKLSKLLEQQIEHKENRVKLTSEMYNFMKKLGC